MNKIVNASERVGAAGLASKANYGSALCKARHEFSNKFIEDLFALRRYHSK
jgi:hypothetical protein